jgi:hypothetical protein
LLEAHYLAQLHLCILHQSARTHQRSSFFCRCCCCCHRVHAHAATRQFFASSPHCFLSQSPSPLQHLSSPPRTSYLPSRQRS